MISFEDAVVWTRTAQPGEQLIYHEGWLMDDRRKDPELQEIATYLLDRSSAPLASGPALVDLIQRKTGEYKRLYIAIKRKVV